MSEAVPSVPLTYLHRMHRDNFTFLIFHVHCVKCVTIPPSSVQCIIYWTLLKYLRRCKIHWYLYCNVDKTFYILMRLIIVVKICFLKFRIPKFSVLCSQWRYVLWCSDGDWLIEVPVTDSFVRWFCYMIVSKTVSACLSSGFWYRNKWGRRILPCNVEKTGSW